MYESMDDEVLERFSVDSLEDSSEECSRKLLKTQTIFDKNPIRSSISFRLHDESNKTRGQSLLSFVLPGNAGEDGPSWNCEIDETVLMRKGLQLNKDGSFSKSPRKGGQDDLPFVMSAARLALIRRRKKEVKKAPEEEEAPSASSGKEDTAFHSELKANGNLTDSMKEALYKKYAGKGKVKRGEHTAVEDVLAKFKKNMSVEGKGKSEVLLSKKDRLNVQLPVIEKPVKLSYFERYQRKNGFNPASISLKGNKPVKDTVRSRFGDSSRDTLSEVSSRFIAIDEDEEEELFYKKMMAEEAFSVGNSATDYSGRTEKATVQKEVKIMKPKGSTSISRWPLHGIPSGRKSGHCCAADHETLTKAELMSKAKEYGNLANTRNIVKMQLKSYRRDWECSGNDTLQVSNANRESFLPPLKDPKGFGSRRWIL